MSNRRSQPNILLISIDSLRPEALGSSPDRYAWRETFPFRVHTPALDRLAREGVLFTSLIVQAPYTPASHASFLTGLNPPDHGIRGFFGYALKPGVRTLAEQLREVGYHTGAFVGADALHPRYGLGRGFDVYDARFERRLGAWPPSDSRRSADETTRRFTAWLEGCDAPFFAFVHYFDVHDIPAHVAQRSDPLAIAIRRARASRLARGPAARWLDACERQRRVLRQCGRPYHVRQVSRVDRHVARLVSVLERRGSFEDTLVAVISDHGDAFGEHGEHGHRQYLYDTTLRVPMILRGGGLPGGRRVDDTVRSVDLLPTLNAIQGGAGVAPHGTDQLDGESLLPLIHGGTREQREAYSETRMEKSMNDVTDLRCHLAALRRGRWKVIVNLLDGTRELYDVANDPGETRNVATAHADVADELATEAVRIHGGDASTRTDETAYSEAELAVVEARLRDLGYV